MKQIKENAKTKMEKSINVMLSDFAVIYSRSLARGAMSLLLTRAIRFKNKFDCSLRTS